DPRPDKRGQLIETLLASADFPTHWSQDVIGPWLGVSESRDSFDQAIALDLSQDVPLDQILDAICAGDAPEFDKTFDQPYMKVDRLVLAFTGMTSQCARCHDHKLTSAADDPRFLQDDNYGLYAFFAVNPGDAPKIDLSGKKFGKPVPPAFVLDGYAKAPKMLPTLNDPVGVRRQTFARLLEGSDAFARGTAHRIWSEVASPLVDPNQFLRSNLDNMA